MLKTSCLNPLVLQTLARCGHGDQLLIADGNYPLDSNTHPETRKIYLNLTHGMPLVTDVLKVIQETIPIEKMAVMVPDDGSRLPIHAEMSGMMPEAERVELKRFEFYRACREQNVKLAIATGEQRVYANLLLTVGVTG